MAGSVELALNEIIVKSKQLLSKLDEFSTDEEANAEGLASLQSEREQLLRECFKRYPIEQIQAYIELVNQVVQLDVALIDKSQQFKQAFASQLIKLKQGKKSAKAYQRF
ncbi:hypothetical protein [Colwellia piezophila]|uniref:hypothetical protein n=1 Tax=Colwellia piezophila TaxID=211668 RepID=UPI00036D7225|nr:hypothetical protein [Colwellia piezophila]